MTFQDIVSGIVLGVIFGFIFSLLLIIFKRRREVVKAIGRIKKQDYKFKEFKKLNEDN